MQTSLLLFSLIRKIHPLGREEVKRSWFVSLLQFKN
jgi:hypothetical protein